MSPRRQAGVPHLSIHSHRNAQSIYSSCDNKHHSHRYAHAEYTYLVPANSRRSFVAFAAEPAASVIVMSSWCYNDRVCCTAALKCWVDVPEEYELVRKQELTQALKPALHCDLIFMWQPEMLLISTPVSDQTRVVGTWCV